MLVSYLLRLVDSEAARGHLVGEVEDVRTGQTRVFRSAEDLAALLRDHRLVDLELPSPEESPWPGVPDPSSA